MKSSPLKMWPWAVRAAVSVAPKLVKHGKKVLDAYKKSKKITKVSKNVKKVVTPPGPPKSHLGYGGNITKNVSWDPTKRQVIPEYMLKKK